MVFAGKHPNYLVVRDGKLAPPNTPNCVSSQSLDAVHKIAPLSYSSIPEKAIAITK